MKLRCIWKEKICKNNYNSPVYEYVFEDIEGKKYLRPSTSDRYIINGLYDVVKLSTKMEFDGLVVVDQLLTKKEESRKFHIVVDERSVKLWISKDDFDAGKEPDVCDSIRETGALFSKARKIKELEWEENLDRVFEIIRELVGGIQVY